MFKTKIINFAKELGFDLIGFSNPKLNKKYIFAYKNWIKKNFFGEMEYMKKIKERADIQKLLPGCKTIIILGMNYYHKDRPLKKGYARVAMYAHFRDYHKIIKSKLKQLEKFICEEARASASNRTPLSPALTKSYVDTGPILERAYAEQAGLGSIGKNSTLITKEFGSWIFLSEILTTKRLEELPISYRERALRANSVLDLEKSSPVGSSSLCGSCTRCLNACPTKAIIAPGIIDAKKCISYLTIENKKQIPKKFQQSIKNSGYIFGCDICQKVCPHNCRAKQTSHKEFFAPGRTFLATLDPRKILAIKTDQEFLSLFASTPLMRAKLKGLKRNARIFVDSMHANTDK